MEGMEDRREVGMEEDEGGGNKHEKMRYVEDPPKSRSIIFTPGVTLQAIGQVLHQVSVFFSGTRSTQANETQPPSILFTGRSADTLSPG